MEKMAKDYYHILGISRSASADDIKQAYRKQSRELHPDKHKGNKEKEAKFKEVNEAYDILSDPKKRQAYDQFGTADGARGSGGGQGFSGFDSGGGFNFDASNFEGFGDIFESFFATAARGGGRGRAADTRGQNVEMELTVPFADAVRGSDREMSFRVLVTCSVCSGSGGEPGFALTTCPECSGAGQVIRQARSLFGTIQQATVCPRCKGSGKVPEKPCKNCSGEGRVTQQKTVRIHIPAGIDEGQTLRVASEGEAGRQNGKAGDLLVHIRVQPDPRFVREGDDIRTEVSVNIPDTVLGTTMNVPTVQGDVALKIPAGTQPGTVLRMKGRGMPVLNTSRHGDHYVTVSVIVPGKLSREERRLYEELKKSW